MGTYIVNFGAITRPGSIGSASDPFGWSEFYDRVKEYGSGDFSDIYYVYGHITISVSPQFILSRFQQIARFNNQPWGINNISGHVQIRGEWGVTTTQYLLGGKIFSSGNVEIEGGARNLWNMYLSVGPTGTILFSTGNTHRSFYCFSCTFYSPVNGFWPFSDKDIYFNRCLLYNNPLYSDTLIDVTLDQKDRKSVV